MRFSVYGMNCVACSSRVESAVKKVEGVTSCEVSLLTNSMQVEGTFDAQKIILAVKKAGYSASIYCDKKEKNSQKNNEIVSTAKRLIFSLPLLLVLMYITMGHVMWGWWIPSFLRTSLIVGIVECVLAVSVMAINIKFFINGVKGAIHLAPNMDTLVSLGSLASFIYSLVFFIYSEVTAGTNYLHGLYFESAAMILVLVSVGKLLEAMSKGKTTTALEKLKNLSPNEARIIREGEEVVVDISEVKVGDIVVVKVGESFAVDGVIIEGATTIDEASLTGESIPRDKGVGDEVFTATANLTGLVKVQVEKVGEDTSLSKIIKMVEQSATSKAPIAKLADKVSGVFVPFVLAVALLTTCGYLIASFSVGYALARGISVLVISCPCALGLATPVAIMVANGVGARHGILYKSSEALEQVGKTKIVAFDKTGTLTKGELMVTDILPSEFFTVKEVLSFACALEVGSNHPIAKAIVNEGEKERVDKYIVTDLKEIAGKGVSGKIDGVEYFVGKEAFIKEQCKIDERVKAQVDKLLLEGKTALYICAESDFLGGITLADSVKDDSAECIEWLKSMGIKTALISGDNEVSAREVANSLGIDEVFGNLLPENKGEIIERLKKAGKVAMVGDGINDALALTVADTGIAIGAGTDVAIDSADVVLMNEGIKDVCASIVLSKKSLKVIKQNLFWAFIYNAIGIPVSIGAFSGQGLVMSPVICSLCMSVSSFCVVMNALRLNLVKIYKEKSKEKIATYIVEVEGLMCHHCEKMVEEALASIFGVKKTSADYKKGIIRVTHTGAKKETIERAIENKGYKVIKIS